jgi:hypothetical protein
MPAVGDNAVMQTEPSKAEPPNRKRRWFQFSLRTLLIGVTLLALLSGYVVRQRAFVEERQRFLDESRHQPIFATSDEAPDVPWIRRLLGDRAVLAIGLDADADRAERQRAASLFTEACICAVRFEHIPGAPWGCTSIDYVPFSDESAPASQFNSPTRPRLVSTPP